MQHARIGMAAAIVVVIVIVGWGSGTLGLTPGTFVAAQPGTTQIQDAKKEGKLVYYSGETVDQIEELLRTFKQKYGIDYEYWRGDTAALVEKVSAEAQGGRFIADVVEAGSGQNPVNLISRGLLMEYQSPELKAFPPEALKGYPGNYLNPSYVNPRSLAWNTRLVKAEEVPKTWDEVLDPKWQGKIGIQDPHIGGAFNWVVEMRVVLGHPRWRKYMIGLAAQKPKYVVGYLQLLNMLATGEVSLMLPAFPSFIEGLKDRGAPIEWSRTIDPLLANAINVAITAKAPHPNAAKLFVEFLMSREGQGMVASHKRQPARLDVQGPYGKLPLKIMPPTEVLNNFKWYQIFVDDVFFKR